MNNKGFTLIEILIALSIASITIVTLYNLHLQNINAATDQSFEILAPMLAMEKACEIKTPADNSSGNFKGEFSNFKFLVEQEKGKIEDLTSIRVEVTISNGSRIYTLRRYYFSDEK